MNHVRSKEEVANLYRRHGSLVYQICLMLLKNVPDAEDATQTVFQKAMEYDKPFREAALRNMTCEQPEDLGLKELIWSLPEHDRLVLFLYYYQGYTAQEIAELLGKNPSTVRTWLVRARKKLKLRMEAEGYDIP